MDNLIPRVQLRRVEVETRLQEGRAEARDWLLCIDPETLAARMVRRNTRGFVADVEGHEDSFPLAMALENRNGSFPAATGSWRAHPVAAGTMSSTEVIRLNGYPE